MVDLSRPCDACGKMIGGGFKYCPKCQIYLCFLCSYQLMCSQNKFPIECPMAVENLNILNHEVCNSSKANSLRY